MLLSLAAVAFLCATASAQSAAPAVPTPLNAELRAAEPSAPSLGAVAREIPRDLWKFFSWDTAMVLGAGGGAALIGHVWDDDLAGEIETNPSLNNAMEPGHTYG